MPAIPLWLESLLRIGLANAIVAMIPAGLAVLASLLPRLKNRPAVAHTLWVLALLKLLTPPLISVPMPSQFAPRLQAALPALRNESTTHGRSDAPATEVDAGPQSNSEADVASIQQRSSRPGVATISTQAALSNESAHSTLLAGGLARRVTANPPATLLLGIAVMWLTGSFLSLISSARRIMLFRRLLRFSLPASPELLDQVREVAKQLCLRRTPPIRMLLADVPPMLWSLGRRATLLLPLKLWERLDDEKRVALIAHELSHWRRGDHYVRWIELAAGVLYWWHPIIWWGRRSLHEAEEQCCDAWVVWTLPRSAKAYATALIDALDDIAQPAPVLACGLGNARDLTRRITGIMRGGNSPRLSVRSRIILLAVAMGILSFMPARAALQPDLEETMTDRSNTRASMPSRLLRATAPAVLAAAGFAAAEPSPAFAADGERPAVREGDRPVARDGDRPKEGDRPIVRDGERPKDGDRPRDGDKPREARVGGEVRRGGPPVLVKTEGDTLILHPSTGDKDVPFTLPEGTTITVNERPATVADLKPGMLIRTRMGPDARMIVDGYTATAVAAGGERVARADGEPRRADTPRDGERPKEGDRPRDGEARRVDAPRDAEARRVNAPRDGERPKEGDRPRDVEPRRADAPREADRPRGEGERPKGEGERAPAPGLTRGSFIRVAGSDVIVNVKGQEAAVPVGDAPVVRIGDGPAQLADLKPGMTVVISKREGQTYIKGMGLGAPEGAGARDGGDRPREGGDRPREGDKR